MGLLGRFCIGQRGNFLSKCIIYMTYSDGSCPQTFLAL